MNYPKAVNQRMDETWMLLQGSGGPAGYSTLQISYDMGLLNFNQPVLEDTEVQGTYIYPDWVTCVKVCHCVRLAETETIFVGFVRAPGKTIFCKEDTTAKFQILQTKAQS